MRIMREYQDPDFDLDPTEEIDLEGGEWVPGNPDARVIFMTDERFEECRRMAQDEGLSLTEVLDRESDRDASSPQR